MTYIYITFVHGEKYYWLLNGLCVHTLHNLRLLWQLLRRCSWFLHFQFVWNWFQIQVFGTSNSYQELLLSWASNFSNSCHNWEFRSRLGCECVEVVLHVAPFITILSFTFLFKKGPVKLYRNSIQGIRSYWQNVLHSEDLSWLELCVLFSEYILVGNICAFAKLASIELKNLFQGKFWIFMSMVVSSEWWTFHPTSN